MNITLTGQPKSSNHIYKSVCRGRFPTVYLSPEGKALKEQYQWEARAQHSGDLLTERLRVAVTLFFGTRRTADLDNYQKLSLDALTGIVWEDDKQIDELLIRRDYDKERPRIELTIEPYGQD